VAYSITAKPPGGQGTWTVVDRVYRTVAPVEERLSAHRTAWSQTRSAPLPPARAVEHTLVSADDGPQAATLESRLAALISFYRWQAAVHDVPVAGWLLRGAPRRVPALGDALSPGRRVGSGRVLAGAGAMLRGQKRRAQENHDLVSCCSESASFADGQDAQGHDGAVALE
jgi:hypothetical protein